MMLVKVDQIHIRQSSVNSWKTNGTGLITFSSTVIRFQNQRRQIDLAYLLHMRRLVDNSQGFNMN